MSEAERLELHQNRLRLQEVTAALELDKENEELLDLKEKLEEVINLTTSLLGEDDEQSWKQGDLFNQKKPLSNKKKAEDRMRKIEKKKSKKVKMEEKNNKLEKICEKEKNKWLNFNKKMTKQLKSKKSIFASPETIDGRVGVGTCGTGGRPMTKYSVNTSYLRKY